MVPAENAMVAHMDMAENAARLPLNLLEIMKPAPGIIFRIICFMLSNLICGCCWFMDPNQVANIIKFMGL